MKGVGPGIHERGAGSGKFFLDDGLVRLEFALGAGVLELLRSVRLGGEFELSLVISGSPLLGHRKEIVGQIRVYDDLLLLGSRRALASIGFVVDAEFRFGLLDFLSQLPQKSLIGVSRSVACGLTRRWRRKC